MKNALTVLIRGVRAQIVIPAFVMALVLGYLVVRVQYLTDTLSGYMELVSMVQDLSTRADQHEAALDYRIGLIEKAVFGELVPASHAEKNAPPPTLTEPRWHVERDKALQERVRALEDWRFKGGKP